MKRLKLTFAALAVIIAVGGASATSHKTSVSTQDYYWYDPSGNLMDSTPSPHSPEDCLEPTGVECARGFIDETDTPLIDEPDLTEFKVAK